ncbi:MAG: type II toxin-antitoxin system HicB family antitoxin [Chloroflexi bacterium]|nr:type II toxin-antitoxin system HicB family antitoxin [Chloroflexota bacterium]
MQEKPAFHVIKDGIVYELREVPDGGYFISVPALPGCTSFGETIDAALSMVREAMELWVEFAREQGLDVPDEIALRQAS